MPQESGGNSEEKYGLRCFDEVGYSSATLSTRGSKNSDKNLLTRSNELGSRLRLGLNGFNGQTVQVNIVL